MKIELSTQELDFLKMLLAKEVEETRVEAHHAKNIEFKAHLQARAQMIHDLVERMEVHSSV